MPGQFTPEDIARFENCTWSNCAKGYMDGFGALVGEAISPLLDSVSVKPGDRVLDLGTGPGLVAAAAAERGAESIGIDFSKEMLTEARRNFPNLVYHEASIEALPFDDESFEVAVGNFVFHHAADPAKALSEAFRVLRPGGRLGLTVWGDMATLEAFGLFFAAVEEHASSPDLPHGPLFGVSDFEVFHGMLRDAGFVDSSVRGLEIAWKTSSLKTYLAAFGDWANQDAFPPEVWASIEASVLARAEPYRRGELYTMPNPAILACAVK